MSVSASTTCFKFITDQLNDVWIKFVNLAYLQNERNVHNSIKWGLTINFNTDLVTNHGQKFQAVKWKRIELHKVSDKVSEVSNQMTYGKINE